MMDERSRPEISLQHCSAEVVQLATNFSQDYLDYVENLPFDLQRKVTKLRELDMKCRENVREMERLYESFVKDNDGSNGFKKRTSLLKIQQLFAMCKELGDEKISTVQSISEVIEIRNKQLENASRKFTHAYEPNVKAEHNGKKEKDKSDTKGTKRPRRQRNAHSGEKQEKSSHSTKDDKAAKLAFVEEVEEPPAKMSAPLSPDQSSSVPTPALTRAAQRDEDKRAIAKSSKDKKEEKNDVEEAIIASSTSTSKADSATYPAVPVSSAAASSGTTSTKHAKNNGSSTNSSSSVSGKGNNKGKKKKRKSNKTSERQASNSGEVSPLLDMPIDPDEPTYCLCQQVSFGQMIGCDNPKCPIEWFHFSCVRLTHKPKGRWYCPDCTIKMKERKRESKRGDQR